MSQMIPKGYPAHCIHFFSGALSGDLPYAKETYHEQYPLPHRRC